MSIEATKAIATRDRRRKLLAGVLLVLIAAGVAVWLTAFDAPAFEDREIVGTWRIRWDGSAIDLPLEYDFLPDRTCVIRNINPASGATKGATTNLTWRLRGTTLVVTHPAGAVVPRWSVLGLRQQLCEVFTLTPDGPGQFRYQGTIEAGGRTTQPPVTGTMTRSGPVP